MTNPAAAAPGASPAASQAPAETTTRTVTFENEGATLSGTLYLPAAAPRKALPVVVVTGTWTSVQEQMPRVYAREMIVRGFAALTFDSRGWGKSGDFRRNHHRLHEPFRWRAGDPVV